MSAAIYFHEAALRHDPGSWHPESPDRLRAVVNRLRDRPSLREALEFRTPQPVTTEALLAVHDPAVLARLELLDRRGGGELDADTVLSEGSLAAARLAAGAGLGAIDDVANGAPFGFCLMRPPGHHATPTRSMGFCLFNNVAVAAAHLRNLGQRVAILDWDAHHGNGTQDIFYDDPSVLFVSWHEFPQYPGTGRLTETGDGAGAGYTLNLPLPPGTGEATYLRSWDELVEGVVEQFAPNWILISAGYDGHRADPITDLGLRARSFGLLAARVQAAAQRLGASLVGFLEGGYNLDALADSAETTMSALVDVDDAVAESPASPDVHPVASTVIDTARERFGEWWSL